MNNVKGILFTTWIFVSVYKTRGDEIINMNGAFISSTGQVYANMAASRAIDGIANTSAETCRCCTVIQRPAQIVLNLTRPYWVSRIEVLGRTDSGSDQNFNIQLETALQLEDFTSQILKNGRYPSTIAEFNPPQLAQLIRINGTGANDTYMAVCEITVYQNASGLRLLGWANQSSTYTESYIPCLAANALNGKNNSDNTHLCSECSVTQNVHSSWEVDLGRNFLIRSINVYGRSITNAQHQTTFLQAFIRLTRDSTAVPVNNASSTFGLALLFTPLILARYVKIQQQDAINMYMALCEVEIFAGECPPGRFGDRCDRYCHCSGNCDSITGECAQCLPGWKPGTCSAQCDNGYFGQNCSSICHCRNISTCHRESGQCSDGNCASGWIGSNCSATCKDGFFGVNCSSPCHCQPDVTCTHTNGQCANMQCAAGWTGENCSAECEHDYFGINCSSRCHCREDATCDHIYGNCSDNQCGDGYTGDNCSEECEAGKFGVGCASQCHCQNNPTCNHVNGGCNDFVCAAGWASDNCSIACKDGFFGINCTSLCHCHPGVKCNHTNGQCANMQCAAGWTGENCSAECEHDYFGMNCSSRCHCRVVATCDHINGNCSDNRCGDGYTGDNCSKECEADKFGVGCASQCHCQNSPTCNHVNGSCYDFVCAAGWASGNCSIECLPGTYGKNCSSDCNCEGCNHVTGSCALAKSCFTGFTIRSSDAICTKCNRGLYGDNCSMECHCDNCHNINGSCALLSKRCHDGFHFENGLCKADDLKSTQAAAIGGGVGAAVSAIVVAAVVVIVIRKRHVFKKEAQLHNDTEMTDISKTLRSSIGQDNNAFSDVGNKAFENLDSDYYSFKSVAPGIKIHLLWDNIREKRKYGSSYFSDEFAKLPTGLIHKHDVASSPENSGKNRYREMFAYDHSRVPLKKEKPSDSDYINACYIHGFEKVNKFIASQGPTEKMIVDFWRMIWQQRVEKIIMLTNLMELGTLKCLQYWPEEIGSVSTFGDVNVKFIGIEETYDFNIRTLNIHKGQEKRHVKQFHFKSWPDKDVPDTTWCLLDFWRAVDTNDSTNTSPIVVHCSAGVGRTGTFIALDTLINLGRMEGYVTPFPMVEALRQQRVNMVQTKDQYVYMHEALADAFLMGTHHVLTRQFENVFKYMIGNEKGSNITRVDKQFDLIVRSVEDSSREVNAFAHASCEPIYGNLDNAISEIDAYRPQLLKRGSNYIQQLGVEFIPAFGSTNALLVCMSPTDQHLEEFWSLAEEHHVTTMINLSAPGSAAYETCKFLGGRGSGRVGKFAVKYIQEKKNNGIVERSFSCRDDNHEGENNLTTIKQFHLTSWLEGSDTPPDMQSFLDLIAKALDSQPQLSDSKPILIHCQTGFIRCGLTALVMNEMVRIRKENGQINIVESAKTMKTKFRDLVQSKAQYRFCYEAILSYIKNAETYQNL
ncbi:uncharacterized protein LOC127851914 isoform X14 [Dreissena polymorpha]|uniref:uncharacterized protein LOC127851914 isoform X14 n=1 Tax=Dreissena polymorpha TaxID=45954 RepID=UPI0022643119|nr:uncharacterized protein LOC127851914 isoform X14 [Dreissena polymorpha]